MATEINKNFVVVAHNEWELECLPNSTVKHFAHLAGYNWCATFSNQFPFTLECQGFKKDGTKSEEVHMELSVYVRQKKTEKYVPWTRLGTMPQLITFTKESSSWSKSLDNHSHPFSQTCKDCVAFLAVNVRILKDRAMFHDFTVDQPFEGLEVDLELKVADQSFYVNKRLHGLVSSYFFGILNSNEFVKAKKDTFETVETDVALFHDFLLAIMPSTNKLLHTKHISSKDLAGFMRLAQYYGVDWLAPKFELSLKLCREIPIAERILLATKYGGGKEFNVEAISEWLNNLEM